MEPFLPEVVDGIRIYTTRQIQAIFYLNYYRANCLVHMRGFPSFRINHRFYVEDSSLRKWLETPYGKEFVDDLCPEK